jgi:hypothetical protein
VIEARKFNKSMRERLLRPRNILVVVAGLELILLPLDFLFRGPPEPAGWEIGVVLTKTYFAGHPLLTVAALAMAASGRVRPAIVALAAIEITRWLYLTAWVVLQGGLPLEDVLDIQWTAANIFIFPAVAAYAIALAVRGARLGLASALIGIPTLHNLVSIMAYALGVLINGL